jgi:hypothetical protein
VLELVVMDLNNRALNVLQQMNILKKELKYSNITINVSMKLDIFKAIYPIKRFRIKFIKN